MSTVNTARIKDEYGRSEGHVVFDGDWWRIGKARRRGIEEPVGRCDDPTILSPKWVAESNDGQRLTNDDGTVLSFATLGATVAALAERHEAAGRPWPAP